MKIDIENYRIESDQNCFVVKKIGKHGPESKKAGEENVLDIKYYPDFEQCLKSVARSMLLESSATSLYQAATEIVKLNEMITRLFSVEIRKPKRS